jgi:nicotinamide riboside transporter PnuC
MCFSPEASIRSLLAGVFGSLLCISLGTTKDKIVGYFLGFVSLMQGIEYLLWKHQKCDNYNKVISITGMILNHLQPFILGVIVLILNPKIEKFYH